MLRTQAQRKMTMWHKGCGQPPVSLGDLIPDQAFCFIPWSQISCLPNWHSTLWLKPCCVGFHYPGPSGLTHRRLWHRDTPIHSASFSHGWIFLFCWSTCDLHTPGIWKTTEKLLRHSVLVEGICGRASSSIWAPEDITKHILTHNFIYVYLLINVCTCIEGNSFGNPWETASPSGTRKRWRFHEETAEWGQRAHLASPGRMWIFIPRIAATLKDFSGRRGVWSDLGLQFIWAIKIWFLVVK